MHAAKELTPLCPINPDGNHLRVARAEERFEQRRCFAGRNFHRPLAGEEFGDTLIPRDITFAAEHAPVNGECRQTERLTMMRQCVDESVGRAVISLLGIAELEDYIATLEAEIARVRGEISAKQKRKKT